MMNTVGFLCDACVILWPSLKIIYLGLLPTKLIFASKPAKDFVVPIASGKTRRSLPPYDAPVYI